MEQDAESLQDYITNDSTWFKAQYPKIILLAKDSLSEDSAIALVQSMLMFSEFKPHNGTYTNIINSGDLGLIHDYQIREHVVDYYKTTTDYQLIDEYFHKFNTETLMPYLVEHYDIVLNQFANPNGHKDHRFKNVAVGFMAYKQQRYEGFSELLEVCEKTLSVLKE